MALMTGAPSVDALREAMVSHLATHPLRRVARQVGMSATGLQKFVGGAHPFSFTRRKLERWFVLHGPGRAEAVSGGGAALGILRVLVQDLPPARHRPGMERLAQALEEAYAAPGALRPPWLDELRGELARLDPA